MKSTTRSHACSSLRTLGHAVSVGALILGAGCSPTLDEDDSVRTTKQFASSSSSVMVNQLGYIPAAKKIGVYIGSDSGSLDWEVVDSSGSSVLSGSTVRKSADSNSGDVVHHADFSGLTTVGSGYKLRVGSSDSEPFDIKANIYGDSPLPYAAMKYFYWKRSGVSTSGDSSINLSSRSAGHTGDSALGAYNGWRSGTFDVAGGWYDAGDFTKYNESQSIAAWSLGNAFERLKDETDESGSTLASVGLNNGEGGNGIPDFLDELVFGTRWVRGSLPNPGTHISSPGRSDLAANKCGSEQWPGYPISFANDTVSRSCMGPSTSATHSAARNLAMTARLLTPYGSSTTNIEIEGVTSASGIASKFWETAEEAYHRAKAAGFQELSFDSSESPGFNVASGPYLDDDHTDDEYGAAVELYLTACARGDADAASYRSDVMAHEDYMTAPTVPDWGTETPLGDSPNEESTAGTMSLLAGHTACTGSLALPSADITTMENNLKALADSIIANLEGQNFPFYNQDGGQVVWGSNGAQANAVSVLTAAFEVSGDQKYLANAFRLMDYLLGVNPMKTSYITGIGEAHVSATHDRALNAATVHDGLLVGGPLNVQDKLNGTQLDDATPKSGPGLKRFANSTGDGGASWESEENTVNWNGALAAAAFGLQFHADELSGSGGGGTTSSCGDGTCDSDEDCSSCSTDCGSCPTSGTGTALPARIQAQDYDAAYETTPGTNSGGACDRGDGVDMQTTSDSAGGTCNIGWTEAGEWVEFNVDAGSGGSFDIMARVAANATGKAIRIKVDGVDISGSLSVPALGWQSFSNVGVTGHNLSSGAHTVRIELSTGSTNLNFVDFIGGGSTSSCGDGTCNSDEDCSSCSSDCGSCSSCGDGVCDSGEDCSSCSTDCGSCSSCGDGVCDSDEDCSSCSTDCGSCPVSGGGSGTISWEKWTGLSTSDNSVSAIPLSTAPDSTGTFTSFEAPSAAGDGYGMRVRGYLTAPTSGNYVFWIASDDDGELHLSTDNTPTNKQLIASVDGWTASREWDKFASQKSATVYLTAGQDYYIEALFKEGAGGDNMAVGWAMPGQSTTAPSEVIPGTHLSPYSGGSTSSCGDGVCDSGEDCSSCSTDCGSCSSCGDGVCDSGEDCSSCSSDCGSCSSCGDGVCDSSEDCSSCSSDCGSCTTTDEPCTPQRTLTAGEVNSGDFNTTGAFCFRTDYNIGGWGCSNFDGRSVSVNGGTASSSCGGAMPQKHDGYYYFDSTSGNHSYASIYWW